MRPHGKYARVSQSSPESFAVCDRCGFFRNSSDLVWQDQWAGTQIYSNQILVCKDRCYDQLQEQLRTIILPPDPMPVLDARVPSFDYEEQIPLISQLPTPPANFVNTNPWGTGPALILCDQSGSVALLAQYTQST